MNITFHNPFDPLRILVAVDKLGKFHFAKDISEEELSKIEHQLEKLEQNKNCVVKE